MCVHGIMTTLIPDKIESVYGVFDVHMCTIVVKCTRKSTNNAHRHTNKDVLK